MQAAKARSYALRVVCCCCCWAATERRRPPTPPTTAPAAAPLPAFPAIAPTAAPTAAPRAAPPTAPADGGSHHRRLAIECFWIPLTHCGKTAASGGAIAVLHGGCHHD